MTRKILLCLLVFIFVPVLLFSSTTGKISGRVIDKDTGKPLAGANIVVVGTILGAAADMKGYYFIVNLPPGVYSVKATSMGYRGVVQTNVQVIIDHTTPLNFELSPTVILGETVEIVAKRPLLEKDVTSSQTVTTAEQIDAMPVNTYQQVLVTTPGFVEFGGGVERAFTVRGGRTNEMSVMIDGFYVNDPIGGGVGSDVANVGIAEMAVMTGTYNAEYGNALSAVLNIVTKEGGRDYSGRVRFRTDKYVNPHKYEYLYKRLRDGKEWIAVDDEGNDIGTVAEEGTAPAVPGQNKYDPHYWETRTKEVNDFDTYRPDFYLGGPIPFLGRKNTFFVSGDALDTDTYLGWTGMPYIKERRLNGKLIFRPHKSMKLALGGIYSWGRSKTYSHSRKYVPGQNPTNYEESYMFNTTLTHTLSPSTFYTFRGSRFTTSYERHVYDEEEFFSYQDASGEWQIFNPDGEYTGAAEYDPNDEEYEFEKGEWVYERDEEGNVVDSTWSHMSGVSYEDTKSIITTAKLDLTSQVSQVHQFQTGFEIQQLDIDYLYISYPMEPPPIYVEKYHHKPLEAAAYLQDKMEFERWGMVINAGLRLEYVDTKGQYYVDPMNPTSSEIKDVEKRVHLLPRLGFAHPITDRAVLHFAYGQFIQNPDYNHLYEFENTDYGLYPYPDMAVSGDYTWVGNANLKPERTVSYEVGVNTKVTETMSIDLTLYYKDIYDYIGLRRYLASPVSYHRRVNEDYANSRGIELRLNKRFSNFFGATINYVYSRAEGNASNTTSAYDDWYLFSVYRTYPPKKTVTLRWDQTHTANFVLMFGKPGNWNVTFTGNYGSGLPYTPLSSRGIRIDEPYSARMPWTLNTGVRANKNFKWLGLDFILWADMTNLLNKANVLSVWGYTGKPDATTSSSHTKDYIDRPNHIGPPRTLELGLSVGF